MNVLSLFDGMACGRLALEKAGIQVDNYYASEIDKYAIQIAKKNWPDIIHIGDVQKVKGANLPKIDLLIGGSPCQGFSFAGKQLNFNDPRSKLFFEFSRLVDECKPKWFFLENVKMKINSVQVITEMLGVDPVGINSALVSAQNRRRLYWSNLPIEQPKNKGIMLVDILESNPESPTIMSEKFVSRNFDILRKSMDGKAKCLSAMEYVKNGRQADYIIFNSSWRKLTPIECERLQTVPDNYTKGVSDTQRYKMIGNGWTVDVIAHIFSKLKNKDLILKTPYKQATLF